MWYNFWKKKYFYRQQTPCRLRNFSIVSVLALTISNVFLTLRLLQSDCGHHLNDQPTSLIPRAPILLTPAAACLEYILADSNANVSEKAVFSGLDLKLGRWDQRRMFKVFDFAVQGERFTELSERLNVTLATQSSIEKIFSLVQGEYFGLKMSRTKSLNNSYSNFPSNPISHTHSSYLINAFSFFSLERADIVSR